MVYLCGLESSSVYYDYVMLNFLETKVCTHTVYTTRTNLKQSETDAISVSSTPVQSSYAVRRGTDKGEGKRLLIMERIEDS
jgi:hypothetical protein